MSTKVNSPDELPRKPGIYIMKDKNEEIIYVGKSKSLRSRVRSYFQKNLDRPKTQVLMSHFNSLEYIVTNTEKEALILEANLIKKHKPRYNINLKDDKRYPYVKITDEDFPKIVITRDIGKKGSYYGPFTDVTAVRQTVKSKEGQPFATFIILRYTNCVSLKLLYEKHANIGGLIT